MGVGIRFSTKKHYITRKDNFYLEQVRLRHHRLIDNPRMKTLQILACMFTMVNNTELFAPTLNGIAVRVRCVSSITVVVNAKSLDWLQRKQTKKTTGNEETRSN